ncbi:MAG: outer membrane protein transport protein [bacterium]
MLKKWLSILVVMSIFCLSYVKEGWTAAFEGPGVCVRPLTMGGAFIGLADDWSAVIWNPAGLTQLEGKGFGFSLDYVPAEASDSNSVANRPLNQINMDQQDVFFQLGGEPTEFNKKDVKSTTYLPTLAGYTSFRGFILSGAIYVPMGYSSDWEDSKEVVQKATYEISSFEIIYNLNVAKQVTDKLSIGAGINLLDWTLEKKAEKKVAGYTQNLDLDGDGQDFEGIISLFCKCRPDLNLGFVYHTGSKIDVKGDAKTQYPFPTGTITPPWIMMYEKSNFTLKQQVPATYILGIAYKPQAKLVITADWHRTDWSKQKKEMSFNQDGLFLKDTVQSVDWKDTNKIRLGAEYTLNELWKLRAGFFTDPSPMPDKAVSLTNLIDIDRVFYTLGAGCKYNNWQVDMGIMHNKQDQTIEGVTYEKKCTSIHIATSRQL